MPNVLDEVEIRSTVVEDPCSNQIQFSGICHRATYLSLESVNGPVHCIADISCVFCFVLHECLPPCPVHLPKYTQMHED